MSMTIKYHVRLQPASKTDHITDDGTELTQKPYPFVVDDQGLIQGDLWEGRFIELVGFQRDLAKQQVDVWWEEVYADPSRALGLYMITADANNDWSVHATAVESAEVVNLTEQEGS